jgi:hypothetical protein
MSGAGNLKVKRRDTGMLGEAASEMSRCVVENAEVAAVVNKKLRLLLKFDGQKAICALAGGDPCFWNSTTEIVQSMRMSIWRPKSTNRRLSSNLYLCVRHRSRMLSQSGRRYRLGQSESIATSQQSRNE